MAIKSYNPLYLDDVSTNLGTMFEYAVRYGYDPITFWDKFSFSIVAKQIEEGNPRFLSGYSAIDLLNYVISTTTPDNKLNITEPCYNRSEFYWAGWALAQYQNYKATSFYNINQAMPIEKVISLYNTLHEADITKFIFVADEYIDAYKPETNLKKMRKIVGLSQKELAEKAEVSIRNIQMYEQRKNNINKAQVDILYRISKTLGCNIEDLFEI